MNINNLKIAVCCESLKDLMKVNRFEVFTRSGVVRLGKENRNKIIDSIINFNK